MKLIFNGSANFKFNSEIEALEQFLNCQSTSSLRQVFRYGTKLSTLIIYNSGINSVITTFLAKIFGFKVYYCFHEPFYSLKELRQWKWHFAKYTAVNLLHFISLLMIDKAIVFSNFGYHKIQKINLKKIDVKISGLAIQQKYPICKKKEPVDKIKISFLGSINQFKDPMKFINKNYSKFEDLNIEYTLYTQDKIRNNYENVKVVSKPLSDHEFRSVIINSSIIHIPHIHCTQSGILALALSLAKPVLINLTENYHYEPIIDGFCGIADDNEVVTKLREFREKKMSENALKYYNDNLKFNIDAFQ